MATAVALTSGTPVAYGVTTIGRFEITVTPSTVMQNATYYIDSFRVQNKETVTGYTFTFPSDTNASAATPGNPADTLTVSPDGRTVTVVLGTPVAGPTTLPITLNNVRNPSVAGTYAIPSVTFQRQGTTDETVSISTTTYTITGGAYLSMTITTPDPGQVVAFGAIDPGIATTAERVIVAVTSSADYTIARSVGGDSTLLGLGITGSATGTKTAGTATWADDYVLTPPWTTDPEVPLVATVTYTVTQ